MFSQSADQPVSDQSPAPIGMRELPPQPAKPTMPAYAASAVDVSDDEAGPGPDDSVIARDDHLEGTFTSRGTVRVLGSVKGRIEAVRVRIEDGAHVDADVIVDEAIIAGEFTGNLTCRERLEARASGRINGRVETHKLMLHEGASVEGEMHMLTESPVDPAGTIRGSAPVRGADKPTEETKPSGKSESAAPASRGTDRTASSVSPPAAAKAAAPAAPARTAPSVDPSEPTRAPSVKPPVDAQATTAPRTSAYSESVRVMPRTTTRVGASSPSPARNGNGTTTTGF